MQELPKQSGVYLITNSTNKKVYIGSSIDMKRRIRAHTKRLNHKKHTNRYLQAAWNKYGENAFSVSVFVVCFCDPEKLTDKEQEAMDKYKSYDKRIGYDLNPTTKNSLGYKFTDEQKAKVKKAANTPERKARRRELSKIMWSDKEYKAKMATKSKERWSDPAFRKKVAKSITPAGREKMGAAISKAWETKREQYTAERKNRWKKPGNRERYLIALKAGWTPEAKAKQSETLKQVYNNESMKQKISAQRKAQWKNKSEKEKEKVRENARKALKIRWDRYREHQRLTK